LRFAPPGEPGDRDSVMALIMTHTSGLTLDDR